MKKNIVLPKFYKNLKYEVIPEKFEGELTYVADFDCGDYLPYAVWHNAKPNRDKKHKEFMMLTSVDGGLLVMGMERTEMEPFLTRSAVHCLNCGDVVYSMYRHDYAPCSCEHVAIDGGSDYTKVSYKSASDYVIGTLDLETKKFRKLKDV